MAKHLLYAGVAAMAAGCHFNNFAPLLGLGIGLVLMGGMYSVFTFIRELSADA